MTDYTTTLGLPYPTPDDPIDPQADIQGLAEDIDARLLGYAGIRQDNLQGNLTGAPQWNLGGWVSMDTQAAIAQAADPARPVTWPTKPVGVETSGDAARRALAAGAGAEEAVRESTQQAQSSAVRQTWRDKPAIQSAAMQGRYCRGGSARDSSSTGYFGAKFMTTDPDAKSMVTFDSAFLRKLADIRAMGANSRITRMTLTFNVLSIQFSVARVEVSVLTSSNTGCSSRPDGHSMVLSVNKGKVTVDVTSWAGYMQGSGIGIRFDAAGALDYGSIDLRSVRLNVEWQAYG